MPFDEWFRHARQGHRCVVFSDPTYNAETRGFQTIEIRFRLSPEGGPPQLEYVSTFRWFREDDFDVDTNWEFDERGELCCYSQAHFVAPYRPVGAAREAALSVLRNLYETWLTFREFYRVEYPDEEEAQTG